MRKAPPFVLIAALFVPMAAAAAPADKERTGELAFRLDLARSSALDNLVAARLKPLPLAQPVVKMTRPKTNMATQRGESAFARILKKYSNGAISADSTTRAAAKRTISSTTG